MKVVKSLIVAASLLAAAVCRADPVAIDQADIQAETALIKTRNDLQQWNKSRLSFDPLAKLSPKARVRLLERSTYDKSGVITSLYVQDIRRELTPSQAYGALSIFGAQSLAASLNSGLAETDTDHAVLRLAAKEGEITPFAKNSYCNGGYCTSNDAMVCAVKTCRPPVN